MGGPVMAYPTEPKCPPPMSKFLKRFHDWLTQNAMIMKGSVGDCLGDFRQQILMFGMSISQDTN